MDLNPNPFQQVEKIFTNLSDHLSVFTVPDSNYKNEKTLVRNKDPHRFEIITFE